MKRVGLKLILLVGVALLVTKGLAVRKVVWEVGAPISFKKVVAVNEKLIGRPIWLVSEKQVRHYLKGELVGQVKIRKKFPFTVVVIAEPPQLVGVIPKGSHGIIIDEKGFRRAKVPLSATRLPFIMLPDNVPVQKCMSAVRRILRLCNEEGICVRAVWLSRYGEVAIYLPEGFWLRLGNPTALQLKIKLGKVLHQNKLVQPSSVVDLSVPSIVSLWKVGRD